MNHAPRYGLRHVGDPMHTLTGLGWDWKEDGVILTIQIDGVPVRVFTPLPHVWSAVHDGLSSVGCPFPAGVGGPITVSGLFSEMHQAKRRHFEAVKRGRYERGSVGGYVGAAPGEVAALVANVVNTQYASQPIVRGTRADVDRIFAAVNDHLSRLQDSGADRAAIAQQIADELNALLDMQGHKNDPPFSYYRKYIDTAFTQNILPAINSLHHAQSALGSFASGIAHAATSVMKTAASAAKAAVHSKILRTALDAAAFAVPALAPAAAAMEVANQVIGKVNQGVAAAQEIKQGIVTQANMTAVQEGIAAKQAVAVVVQKAQQGVPEAQQIVGALQRDRLVAIAQTKPNPKAFLTEVLTHSPQLAAVHGPQALAAIAQNARPALRRYTVRRLSA